MNKNGDLLLITRCLLWDDRKAFADLVSRYEQGIRRFFLHQTLGNPALSDDLAQETFIRVYQKLHLFKGLSRFYTWLYRIAYHVFCDYIVQERRYSGSALEEAGDIFLPGDSPERKLDIYASLRILRAEERTAITLFYMEDLEIGKIATIMHCPAGTVKSHLSRAKTKLKTYLNTNGYGNKE